jgi:hypothetical protein
VFEVDQKPEGDRPGEDPRAVNIRLAENASPAVDNEWITDTRVPHEFPSRASHDRRHHRSGSDSNAH